MSQVQDSVGTDAAPALADDRVVFTVSTPKTLLMVVTALLFVAGSAWLAFSDGPFDGRIGWMAPVHLPLGLIFAGFFTWIGAQHASRLFAPNGAAIVLSPEGLQVSTVMVAPIPWSEFASMWVYKQYRTRTLELRLTNPAAMKDRLSPAAMRGIEMRRRLNRGDLSLASNSYNVRFEPLEAAVRDFGERYGAPFATPDAPRR